MMLQDFIYIEFLDNRSLGVQGRSRDELQRGKKEYFRMTEMFLK